jgi:uncharacterized protein
MQHLLSTKRKDRANTENTIFQAAFDPLPGFSSPHLQTIMACFVPGGLPPPSQPKIIRLNDGDALCCEVSTPKAWTENDKTVVMIHGLCGCHSATYMVRASRKFYQKGYRAIRLNMRSCGSGSKLAKLPYHGGLSSDILQVIQVLKKETPASPITLIGFSLGGNIALKLAGELGEKGMDLIDTTIAICPPIDLGETAKIMARPTNTLYNRYYMYNLDRLTKPWTKGRPFKNIYEFDELVTAPTWGFNNPQEYYTAASSRHKLAHVKHTCHILFAEDDPFIDHKLCLNSKRSDTINVWLSKYGGHMGFLGWADQEHGYFWLDKLLLDFTEKQS